jgi:pimeloyl-ACP methyl ester carboxylesterase
MGEVEWVQGMRVVHDGVREAPGVVLVHGSGASGGSWGPVVRVLAGEYHVVRVDLPRCGLSPGVGSYKVTAQADRVAGVLDELGLRRVVVVGHSSGGYVATALVERWPELVGAVGLVSTGPGLDALLPQPVILRVLLAPPFGPLVWAWRTDGMMRKGLASVAVRPVEIPDEVVEEVRGTSYRAMRAVLRCNGEYIAERSVPERLAALGGTVPVLVVFGAADPRWDPASARRYGAVARVEMLAGVGHLPMFEAPQETGRLLLDFAAALR